MQKIKQLPLHEAQKIAAGEVVERPGNVVKELIENALDACATSIVVYIETAGQTLIRVVDNGSGMSSEDAEVCFGHHATSKITTVSDLMNLTTFGFRGEALSSIAAVSSIEMFTKQAGDESGTFIKLAAGQLQTKEQRACSVGTDIAIKDLFYNVPARKKFLKKAETELRAIVQLFNAFCLDYPAVYFKLYSENKMVHTCPPTHSSLTRASQIWSSNDVQNLLPLSEQTISGITISGVISNHQYYKYDRSHIYFFVNKRWVKNMHLGRAVLRGYTNVIPPDRYPIIVLTIEINTSEVDINIHPRKEEVQFLHSRTIENIITNSIKKTLEDHLSSQLKKEISFTPYALSPDRLKQDPFSVLPVEDAQIIAASQFKNFQKADFMYQPRENHFVRHTQTSSEKAPAKHGQTILLTEQETDSHTIIGQFKNTYLMLEKTEGIFFIDQHAAHERILYELFADRFKEIPTIQLLFPLTISLTNSDIALLMPYLDLFKTHSILLEQCAERQLMIKSIPIHLKNIAFEELITEVIHAIKDLSDIEASELHQKVNEHLQAQMACKAAIKAGDVLSHAQMVQLLKDLEKAPHRFSCPHGRPTGWLLSTLDIEKKFRRKT